VTRGPLVPRAIALLLLLAPAAGAQTILLTGNDDAVWMIRESPDGTTHDIVAKPVDGGWKWIAQQTTGRPAAATVTGQRLHLLLRRPFGYLIYDLRPGKPYDPRKDSAMPGTLPFDPRWPVDAAPIALCDAAELTGTGLPGVIAVVPRAASGDEQATPAATQASQPATAAGKPATQPRTSPAESDDGEPSRIVKLAVFVKQGDAWAHLTDAPGSFGQDPNGRILAAAVGRTLYVMAGTDHGASNRLLAWEGDAWRDIDVASLPAGATAIALLPFEGRLVLVLKRLGREASGAPAVELFLADHDAKADSFILQPVTRDGKTAFWDPAQNLCAARLGRLVALAQQADGQTQFATCDLSGRLFTTSEVTTFDRPPTDADGQEIFSAFLWGLMFAVLVPMLFLRPQSPAKPFALPETMRPASLIKRLLAAFIDVLPWAAVSAGMFPFEAPSPETFARQLAGQLPPSANQAYAVVTMLLMYSAYGVVMERRFGATVGKMIFKLRVVADEGAKSGSREVILRNLVRMMELFFPFGLLLLVILPLVTRYRRRLGDLMARTAVIDAAYVRPEPPETPQPPSGTERQGPKDTSSDGGAME